MPRRRTTSRWRSWATLCLILLGLVVVLQSTSTRYPSRPAPWYLEAYNHKIARDPSPLWLASRAYFFFEHEQFDRAVADIREAIKRNPGDVGQTYVSSSGRHLAPEALVHGEKQLRQMLKDRPQMATYLEPGDELWTWAVRKFAGEDIGKHTLWDASDPSPFDADSHPGEDGPAKIRVRPFNAESQLSAAEAFDWMWACAVFELHNTIPPRDELVGTSFLSKLTREEYIVASIESEEAAVQRTRAFYLDTYLSYSRQRRLASDPSQWHVYTFYENNSEKLLSWKASLHWPYFGAWYDLIRVEDALGRLDLPAAQALLDEFNIEQVDLGADVRNSWHYWRGYLRLNQLRFADAVVEFDQCLVIDGEKPWPDTLLGRAIALAELDRHAEALDDFNRLLKIPDCEPATRYEALVGRAYLLDLQSNQPAALADLQAAIVLAPDKFMAYRQRAELYGRSRNYVAAAADLTEYLRLSPGDALAHYGRSYAHHQQELWPEALADVNAALQLEPDNATYLAHRGWVHFNQQAFEQAAADFARALEMDASSASALAGRGSLTVRWKDHPNPNLELAFNDLLRACELHQWQDAWTVAILATICDKRGDTKQAEEYRQKAREIEQAAAKSAT